MESRKIDQGAIFFLPSQLSTWAIANFSLPCPAFRYSYIVAATFILNQESAKIY